MREKRSAVPVSRVNAYASRLLQNDIRLSDLWVSGEIAELSPRGHLWLTLEDEAASLRGVIWASQLKNLSFVPAKGDKVEAHGYISLYEKTGQYQLYIDRMEKAGDGELYARYLELLEKLKAEGVFDPEIKKPLPLFPRRVGIVTSPAGAALRDIVDNARRRLRSADLLLYPAKVQGEGAAEEIAAGIRCLDAMPNVDVIIVARGGGSLEDLWAFNEETLVRAVYEAKTPIISGVGHETDTTLTDLAADMRAPTPSTAAMMAVPDAAAVQAEMEKKIIYLKTGAERALKEARYRKEVLSQRMISLSPRYRLGQTRQNLALYLTRLEHSMEGAAAERRKRLSMLAAHLETASPAGPMKRGFALLRNGSGSIVRSYKDAPPGTCLAAELSDGVLQVEVLRSERIEK